MKRILLTLLMIGFPTWAEQVQQPEETYEIGHQKSTRASAYMVVAANPLAAEAGRAVLARGGSAADAAVAVQLMLNLVEPQSSGLGGGAFALYWDAANQSLSSWDGRERAPLSATHEYWLQEDGTPVKWFDAVVGGRSVGVPGTLKLIETLHREFGALPWSTLFQPAIELAETGFVISPRMAASIEGAQKTGLALFPATKEYFFTAQATPKTAGTLLKNPDFARTLRMISRLGSAPFYHGDIARDIVAAVHTAENTGELTLEDMAQYEVKKRPPVCVSYRAYQVCGMGPPSSGGLTVGQILRLLEPFEMAKIGPTAYGYHLFAEAAKLAYADRALYMADADFVPMPTKGLLDETYLEGRSELIDAQVAMGKAEAGEPPWKEGALFAPDTQAEKPGTSHFSIVDAQGNMISMTTTIETGFGSRVMTGGFLLNNELTDFARNPRKDGVFVANRVEGGKRPRSSMAPTIVLKEGQPVLAIGSPGGSRIINYVAQGLIAILDWGMDPQQAIDLGHVVNRNGDTDLEEGTDALALETGLVALGQSVKIRNLNSGLHVIQRVNDGFVGAADKRREGVALGN